MKTMVILAALAIAFPPLASASVESAKVEAKALFEVLYSMESNGTKGVASALTVNGDYTVLKITLGKAPNSISCRQSITSNGDSTFYDCDLQKEITLPSSVQ
ncbi:MAG: hypothetical protein AAB250_16300 [Bdellovibrionota bacterium]